MDFGKFVISGILAGIVLFIAMMVFGFIVQAVMPYNAMEFGGMRSVDDPLMWLFFVSPWITGFAMALVYPMIKLDGSAAKKGIRFGLMVWVLSIIPSAFIVFTSMNYPLGFTLDQVFGNFFGLVAAGIIIAKMM
ncbi:MAG: hypothetical protein ABIA76_03565 [Candidatus Diapherotrites archaeon]